MKNKISLIISVCVIFLTCVFADAQTSDKANCAAFPVVPVIVESGQSSLFFRQWFSGDPHYAEINAFVGAGDKPVLQLVLIEKDRREVFYVNHEARVKELTAESKEAYFVPVDFKKIAGDVDAQPTYGFGFEDKHKQKVLWRFTPASRPSERGSGLTPLAGVPGLRLLYRNLGTLAGAGTSVRIGDKEFEAEPWTEASAPPYFIAYRGSFTDGLDFGELRTGEENWRVTVCPKEFKEGESWEFAAAAGRKRAFRIASRRGEELQIEESADLSNTAKLALLVRQTSNGFAIRSIERKGKTGGLRISFAPELSLSAPGETTFQIDLGKQKNIAGGTISIEKQGEAVLLKWQFKSPDWAKNKKLTTLIKINSLGYTVKFS
ncbi:MAG: hypothetical protein ACR2MG_02315 [Pyrinomonadaceae bacterium]